MGALFAINNRRSKAQASFIPITDNQRGAERLKIDTQLKTFIAYFHRFLYREINIRFFSVNNSVLWGTIRIRDIFNR
jgi:hypothetical protein